MKNDEKKGRSLFDDIVVGTAIARAEVRDRLRRHTSTRREKALFALIAIIAAPGIVLFIQQSYAFGVLSRDGVDAPVIAASRNILLPAMLVLTVIAGLEAVQQLGSQSVRSFVLTSASTRAIVLGKVLSLLASWLLLVALGFSLLVAYAIGARAPLFLLAVFLAGLPILTLVVIAGLSLGYTLWLGVERLGLSEGIRQLLTAALYILIFVGMFAGGSLLGEGTAEGGLTDFLPTGDPVTPLGWYADLFFFGSPMEPTISVHTLVALTLVFGLIPIGFALLVRLAPQYWYASPADNTEEDTESTEAKSKSFDRRPSETIGRTDKSLFGRSPTARAALGYVRSGIRQPGQFVYLFYYLFPVAPVLIQDTINNPGTFPTALGAVLVILCVWFAGGVFCLNPLGSEGTMLSQLVLSARPAEAFVHARLLVGTLLGVVFAVPGIALLAATTTVVTPTLAVLGTVFVLGTILASASFALGIGSVLPKFETVEIFESVETLAPSIIAAIIHGVVSTVVLLGALLTTLAVGAPESPLSVPERLGVVGLFVVVVAVVSDGSRRYAAARLRDYGRETVRTDRPFAVYTSIVLAFFAFVLGQAIALAAVLILGVDLPMLVFLPLLFVIEYLGYAAVAVGFLYVTHRGWSYLDLHWPSAREIGIVAGGLVVSLGIWAVASALIVQLGLPAADHALFDPEDDATPTLLLALIPLMLFVNGPIEELLYRNVIQKYLTERFSQGVAISIASVVFALAHVPAYLTAGIGPLVVTLALLFVISAVWGVLYAWTESLFVVSAIHGLYNATVVFWLYLTIV